jgi:MFS family permease
MAGQEKTSHVKVALASLIGTAIEWYDFFLYGTAAALIFNKLFFPTFDPMVGTLLAFATYALGFVARPLGGIVFGHYGDKIGRKTMLYLTLLIMGTATALIGAASFRALALAANGAALCSWLSSTPRKIAAASTGAGLSLAPPSGWFLERSFSRSSPAR